MAYVAKFYKQIMCPSSRDFRVAFDVRWLLTGDGQFCTRLPKQCQLTAPVSAVKIISRTPYYHTPKYYPAHDNERGGGLVIKAKGPNEGKAKRCVRKIGCKDKNSW